MPLHLWCAKIIRSLLLLFPSLDSLLPNSHTRPFITEFLSSKRINRISLQLLSGCTNGTARTPVSTLQCVGMEKTTTAAYLKGASAKVLPTIEGEGRTNLQSSWIPNCLKGKHTKIKIGDNNAKKAGWVTKTACASWASFCKQNVPTECLHAKP